MFTDAVSSERVFLILTTGTITSCRLKPPCTYRVPGPRTSRRPSARGNAAVQALPRPRAAALNVVTPDVWVPPHPTPYRRLVHPHLSAGGIYVMSPLSTGVC